MFCPDKDIIVFFRNFGDLAVLVDCASRIGGSFGQRHDIFIRIELRLARYAEAFGNR